MTEADEITLTLPREREFQRVAHLVLGGIAVRHEMTIETLEDLQLAVGSLLDRVEPNGDVTVRLALRGDTVEAVVGPLDVAAELARADDAERLGLGRVLRTLVDDVEVDGHCVRLTKKVTRIG